MNSKVTKSIPKISVKIWDPILEKLNQKFDAACLRRDAYLNKILTAEISNLDQEVSIQNSEESQKYIADCLNNMKDRTLVSLALEPKLISDLNLICKRKNIVRDAFFNRLFLFLAAKQSFIDSFFFPTIPDGWKGMVLKDLEQTYGNYWSDELYPMSFQEDPFWALRRGIDLYEECEGEEKSQTKTSDSQIRLERDLESEEFVPRISIYTKRLQKLKSSEGAEIDATGFNCFLQKSLVPGTDAHKERLKRDKMWKDLF
jgi:hypothetical protein